MTAPVVDAFRSAGVVASRVVNDPRVARDWESASAVEGFTVGGLAAHVLIATARTEQVLDEPEPQGAAVVDLAAFYGANRIDDRAELDEGLHPLIRDTATTQAARGPDAIGQEFTEVVHRLSARLEAEPRERLVSVLQVPGGATSLSTYLATRVVELVVHTDDLATSVGLADVDLPGGAVDVVAGVFLELARRRSGDLAVVRAFARRERASADVLRVL